jgi:hypothetical protein
MSRIFLLFPLWMLLNSCATCWRGGEALREQEMRSLESAANDLRGGKNIVVYRGLAHPTRDAELYQMQLATLPHREFEGFSFHKQPDQQAAKVVEKVVDLYCQPESHQALAAPKTTCHGFHPDYALVWEGQGKTRVLHICYGCHEWKYHGPGGVLHTDINEPAYFDKLTHWLPPH